MKEKRKKLNAINYTKNILIGMFSYTAEFKNVHDQLFMLQKREQDL